MHIVMFSINPLFSEYIMGGAPKHLQQIALHLGHQGHDVTVLCTRPGDAAKEFNWHPRVKVIPELRYKQPFPQPYDVPAYDLSNIIQTVGEWLSKADRFYMHDGEFLFPYVYESVPTVISLRDNVYPETILGGFLFQAHKLVLISEYSRNYYLSTVGRFWPELRDRTTVIYNGIDWNKFQPVDTPDIVKFLGLEQINRPILLHPHRPEVTKGALETLQVVDILVNHYGFSDLLALIPRWHEVQTTGKLKEFYAGIEREIRVRRLASNVMFHEWIPQDLMPQYYSLGTVTLSLGNFVESFGNAVYESIGCGTPSIAARISTHRELVPDELMEKVDFGDIDGAAALAARIIANREQPSEDQVNYVKRHYSIERQLTNYEQVIINAERSEPMTYRFQPFSEQTRFRLAPWCYRSARRGVYHDFNMSYVRLDDIMHLLDKNQGSLTVAEAENYGITESVILELVQKGYLVPLSNYISPT